MENNRINYEIENIIAKLERAIKEEEAKRDAWKAVKIVTKKDGKPFSVFSKNFEGARVTVPVYSLGGGKELTVTTWNPATGYISDTIKLYEVLNAYARNEKAEEKPENIKRNGPGVADYYVYDWVGELILRVPFPLCLLCTFLPWSGLLRGNLCIEASDYPNSE